MANRALRRATLSVMRALEQARRHARTAAIGCFAVVGPERVAVEIYPAESDVMDQANMRHLFVLPEGTPPPFSLRGGRWT